MPAPACRRASIMSTVIESDDIAGTAAAWVVRMDRAALSEAEQLELDAWLEADSRHRGAFIRAQAMWVDLDRVAALGAGRAPVAPAVERPRFRYAASVAAAAVAVALLGSAVSERYLAGRETTQVGEVRRLTLDDGSALALNTDSVLQVKYAADERRIVLRAGEASFQVRHDEHRPFLVQAGDVAVRAVGTAFTVRRRGSSVDVVVSEGVVEVTRGGRSQRIAAQRVSRNQELVVPPTQQPLTVAALNQDEVSRRLSWQEGRLIFQGERLADAVAEVNRYSPTPVVVDDVQLGARAFVGVFRIGDSRSFAQAAAAAFDAQVQERDGALHLEATGD